ncbi:putative adipokinetic hormone preprohormone [Daphnia pulex]|uniref:Putative adipokinetic hormone preprohormone n=1 Tax=Daphnia pulex TaxID=6669 RepID=E9HI02_DAPPU|nr:putative adipokinetic hormone preprohormone [Daphnia pulex]|eukprot:EFX68649.1 putative adipokinetic hormone preprohormone [Daphnia pulex]
MANHRILILTLLMIGLASAQVNFSTSWGKRSPSTSTKAAEPPSAPSYRQNFHSKKVEPGTLETLPNNQHLPESFDTVSSTIYDDAEEQRISISLPSPCLSILKSLLLVNQIVEFKNSPLDGRMHRFKIENLFPLPNRTCRLYIRR